MIINRFFRLLNKTARVAFLIFALKIQKNGCVIYLLRKRKFGHDYRTFLMKMLEKTMDLSLSVCRVQIGRRRFLLKTPKCDLRINCEQLEILVANK